MPAVTAQVAVEFLYEEIVCHYGLVKYFHTDRGTHFNNELMQKMTNKFKIRHHQVTAYHPQANGLIERFNGTLKQMLAKVTLGEEDWDLFIAPCLFAYRTLKIEGIGTTPAFLAMGYTLGYQWKLRKKNHFGKESNTS